MADVFYTILVVWILWRIFGGSSEKKQQFQQNNYSQPRRPEGEVKITSQPKKDKGSKDDDGEYVDYEEIK